MAACSAAETDHSTSASSSSSESVSSSSASSSSGSGSSSASSTGTGGAGGSGGTGGAGGDCGNSTTEAGEECDDGNTMSGDGCSAACKLEFTSPEDVCPGVVIALTGAGEDPRVGTVSGATSGALNHYGSLCGGSGPDLVYVVTSDVIGQLTATISSDYDAVLYARSSCGDPLTELACDDVSSSMGGDTVSFQVTPNTPYYLFVDGYGGTSGNFTLDVVVDTAFCGNGEAEAPEQCDDGNLVAGDGCSPSCAVEPGGIADACPGQSFFLVGNPGQARKLSLLGNTTPLAGAITPVNCSGTGNNAVYAITSDIDGVMVLDLVATYDDATLHVRGECDTSTTQLNCIEAIDPGQPLTLFTPVLANTTYYVIVDSALSTKHGPYSLQVTVSPGACGNDVLDGGEECDDGNAVVGDGCDPLCFLESPSGNNDVCPGAPLVLTGMPEHGVVTATTATLVADYAGSGCATVVAAKDAVYSVTPSINGLLTATVNGSFDSGIYARSDCAIAGAAAQLACVEKVDGNGPEKITFPVTASTTYYLIIDGASSGQEGVFELAVDVTPGTCGNAMLEGGEQCDDGNVAAGDGCDATCQIEPIGPNENCPGEPIVLAMQGSSYVGSVASGTTNLTGNITLTSCTSSGRDAVYSVTAPIDGVLVASVPTAAFNVSLGARSTCDVSASQMICANLSSGNGGEDISFAVTQGTMYYVIVDGTSSTGFGPFKLDVMVKPPGCGDGLVSVGEQCDDGNIVAGDGCDPSCQLEVLAGADVCPGYAIPLVGSGSNPRVGVVTVDTTPLLANYAGTCSGSAREAVFVVTPDVAGTLTAKLNAGYNSALYARSTCADAASQLGCDDTPVGPGARDLSFSVNANTPYYFFVDGTSGAFGASTLQITVTP